MKRALVFLAALTFTFPVVGFSQVAPVIIDNDIQLVAPDTFMKNNPLPPSTLKGPGGRSTVDVVGGTTIKSSNKTALAKGNSYRVDKDVTLMEAEFWLEFSTTQTLHFYVFESLYEFGDYNKIFETSTLVTGNGADWYSSGPISVHLPKDNHYIIAVSWDGTLSYFYDGGDTQLTSFGAYVHGFATGSHPLPPTISSTVNDQAIYHQRLTTDDSIIPLCVDNNLISEITGGKCGFSLNAGAANAGRDYLIFAGVSGSSPGTPLPGGMVTLPVNWDGFTNIVAYATYPESLVFQGFYDTLDKDGKSKALFDTNGPVLGMAGHVVTFAFAVKGPPWDYASNPVDVHIVP